jgi:exodeoxyribonuclease V alpha subunit
MIGPFEFKFRISDKVMQIKNNSIRDVFNGSCGRVVKFVERKREILRANGKIERIPTYTLHVLFNDRDYDVLYEIDEAKKELNLAYAFTTHKAQGSEYEHVLIIMNRPIPGFINRNLIYTGASRGKRSVTIALSSMNIRKGWRDLPAERCTNLVAMIDEKVEFEEEPSSESLIAV